MFIGAENVLAPTEGADQHEQSGPWQVEIGEHCLDHSEFEARIDKEIRRGSSGEDGSRAAAKRVFEGANRCGADGNHTARNAESLIDSVGSLGRDGIRLAMNFVILHAFDADRLEGSEADVQGDLSGFDAALLDAVEDFRGEMKAGGRGCDRSARLGVYGLVALAIAGGIRARDVRREWDVADAIESGEEVVLALKDGLKADTALAELAAGQYFRLQFVLLAEEEAFADSDLAAGPNQAFPVVRFGRELAREQNLYTSMEEIVRGGIMRTDGLSALPAAIEPRRKDAGIVKDHQIAGPQQFGEVAEHAIGVAAAGALQVQHARSVAVRQRFLGDELVGKIKMEVRNQHDVRL